MKHAKRTVTLLLTAAMLTSCLLPMAGCTGTTAAPESPFNDVVPSDDEKEGDKNGDGEKDGSENSDNEATNPPSYFADYETVWAGDSEEDNMSTQKANLYRIPMNDLTGEPQKVVEGIAVEADLAFSERTLYYSLCVFEYSSGAETPINECDGKMYALDLESGESKLIVENSGMTIYPIYAWDDRVFFAGWAYEASGMRYSGGNANLLVAYTSGEPFEIYSNNKFIFGRLETD